jgi:hypothetical protein
MWATEHSIETNAIPQAIWALWSDVARWPEWNADLERAELSGPFGAGGTVTMFPRGQEPIELRIAEAYTLGPQLGPEISGDFPQVLAALVERAEGR